MDSFSFASHSFLYPNYDSSFIVADWCYSALIKVKKALVYLSKSQQEAQIKTVQAKVIHPHKSSQWRKDDFLLDHPNGLWSTPENYNRYLDMPNQFYPLGSIKEENVKTAEVIFIQSGYNIDEIDIAGFPPPNKLLKPALCDTDLYWRIEETSDLKKWKLVQLLASWIGGGKQNMAKLNCLMRLPGEDCDYERFHYETYQLDYIYEYLKKSVKKEIYERFKDEVYDEFEDLSTPTIILPRQSIPSSIYSTYEDTIHQIYGLRLNKLNKKIYDKDDNVFQELDLLYLELRTKGIRIKDEDEIVTWPKQLRTIHAALLSARQYSFDPLQEQFNKWEKKVKENDYVKMDVDKLATKWLNPNATDYENEVLKRWLVGSVERIRKPGCKMELVMVLHGEQGVGKTTFLRTLGGDFFAEDVNFSRDLNMTLTRISHHILELSEMNHSRLNSDLIKTAISNQNERYRGLYEKHMSDVPKRCVFAASTNHNYFLNDPSGNRRFAIVEVTDHAIKNKDELEKIRDDIFCNILATILKDKLIPVLPKWCIPIQNQTNENYSADINEVYEERIADFLEGYDKCSENEKDENKLTMLRIWVGAMGGDPISLSRNHKDNISCIMRKFGYTYKRTSVDNGKRIRVWIKK